MTGESDDGIIRLPKESDTLLRDWKHLRVAGRTNCGRRSRKWNTDLRLGWKTRLNI